MRVAWILIAFACVGASPAWAQQDEDEAVAEAEELFVEGRELLKQGQLDEACARFEASYKLDPAVGTLLNLALCNEKWGKVASAWALYREVEDLARRKGQETRAATARERARLLEAELPRLIIEVAAQSRVPGLIIERDGVALNTALLWQAAYVDPGVHRIVARAPGYEEWIVEVRIKKGDQAIVEIPVLEREEKQASVTTPVPEREEKQASVATPVHPPAVDTDSDISVRANSDISNVNSGQGRSLGLGIGATGGVGWVTYDSDRIDNEFFRADFKMGQSLGLFVSLAPHERFAARLEILYMTKGAEIETSDGRYWSTLDASYLSGVLLGDFNLLTSGSIRPYILVGAELSYRLEEKGDFIGMGHTLDIGGITGAGVGWRVDPRHEITFETRIHIGLRNTVSAESDDYELLNRSLMFMLGYRFFGRGVLGV